MARNLTLTLNIMDASGQERFIPLLKNYYRSADGVIFVFDLTNEKSFEDIDRWLKDVQNHNDYCTKLLIGNKADLENIREVNVEKAQMFAINNEMEYFETSAKDNKNINEIFTIMAKRLIYNKNNNRINSFSISNKSFNRNNNKKNCC